MTIYFCTRFFATRNFASIFFASQNFAHLLCRGVLSLLSKINVQLLVTQTIVMQKILMQKMVLQKQINKNFCVTNNKLQNYCKNKFTKKRGGGESLLKSVTIDETKSSLLARKVFV